jgi:hypothetical protein
MVTRLEVSCIRKNDRSSPHEQIIQIGVDQGYDRYWYASAAEAIQKIEDGSLELYVDARAERREWDVLVVVRNGVKYLTTTPDDAEPNLLLSLGECMYPFR